MIGDGAVDDHNFHPGAPNREITYPSPNFEPYSGAPSGSDYVFPDDVREREAESNAVLLARPDFPWDRPQDGPKTSTEAHS